MARLCWYFQLHQPYRLRNFSVFDVDAEGAATHSYFGEDQLDVNHEVFAKVAQKSYLPMLTLLRQLVQQYPDFTFAISCSGIFLEQAVAYEPAVVALLQDLAASGQVEFLAETYYHSLASLYSTREFQRQVALHAQLLQTLFHVTPTIFRNTELIYANLIAERVAQLGFKAILTDGVERYLRGRSQTQVFRAATNRFLPVLLKHSKLSDDIAFRFSNKGWEEHPLTSQKYLQWLDHFMPGELVNLFMDFETFGEHQWADTGIFQFFAALVEQVTAHERHQFVTPSQVVSKITPAQRDELPEYDVPDPISWADIDRDLTAWRGNPLQYDTLRLIYSLEKQVLASEDQELIADWGKLQTSDHFYYMCIKWSADGDVHKYFSPYDSPFEAYRRYSTVLADLTSRVRAKDTT